MAETTPRITRHEVVDPRTLTPNPANWRRHPTAQVEALRESLRLFGFAGSLLFNERTGRLVNGHARLELALEAGLEAVPVDVGDWSPEEELELLAVYDPISGMAESDIAALMAISQDVGEALGRDSSTLAELLASLMPAAKKVGLTDPDEVPPIPEEPITKPGDLWLLGEHRLLCGDAREPADVARLMGDELVAVAVTSPPYAEQREYDASSGFRPIPPDDYVEWFRPVAANIADHLAEDGSWFLNIKPSSAGLDTDLYVMDLVIAHVRDWQWHFATEFCWERNGVPKSVTQRFKNQFEPVYQFARNRWKMRPENVQHESNNVPQPGGPGVGDTSWANKQGSDDNGAIDAVRRRNRGTKKGLSEVQGIAHDAGEFIGPGMAYPGNRLPTFTATHTATGHAAAFPAGLPAFFILAYSDPGDAIYDPFMGSGSSLIAAEQTARRSFGMEISPRYVDVCVKRWEQFTGKTATRAEVSLVA